MCFPSPFYVVDFNLRAKSLALRVVIKLSTFQTTWTPVQIRHARMNKPLIHRKMGLEKRAPRPLSQTSVLPTPGLYVMTTILGCSRALSLNFTIPAVILLEHVHDQIWILRLKKYQSLQFNKKKDDVPLINYLILSYKTLFRNFEPKGNEKILTLTRHFLYRR